MTHFPAVLAALAARGPATSFCSAAAFPGDDAAALKAMGVAAIFTPGTSTQTIVEWIERDLRPRVEGAAA